MFNNYVLAELLKRECESYIFFAASYRPVKGPQGPDWANEIYAGRSGHEISARHGWLLIYQNYILMK